MFKLNAKPSTETRTETIDSGTTPPQSSTTAAPKNKTYISIGSAFTGDINATGDIFINGSVTGCVTVTNGSITLMRSGKVEGDLIAPHIMIDGVISGRCEADTLEILEHGQLNGIASSSRFSIKSGGIFIGQSEFSAEKTTTQEHAEAIRLPLEPRKAEASTESSKIRAA